MRLLQAISHALWEGQKIAGIFANDVTHTLGAGTSVLYIYDGANWVLSGSQRTTDNTSAAIDYTNINGIVPIIAKIIVILEPLSLLLIADNK